MADFTPLLGVISLLVAAGIPIAILLAYAGKLGEVLPFLKRFIPL